MMDKRRYRYSNRRKKQKRKNLLLLCLFIFGLAAGVLFGEKEKADRAQDDISEYGSLSTETENGLNAETDLKTETAESLEVHFIDVGQGDSVLIKCGENAMLIDAGDNSKGTAVQAGHHGSSSSGSEAFLDAVNPQYMVISCGKGNFYGHPHAELLNSLRKRGVQVFCTDEQGSITVTSDGKTLSFNCAPSETWRSGWEEEP